MKFLAAIVVLLASCKGSRVTEERTAAKSLVGTWELRQFQGGMMANKQYPPGNGNRWQFSDSTYESYEGGNLVKSGRYRLAFDTTVEAEVGLVIPRGQYTNRIIFDNDTQSPKTFLEISNNQLTLLSGFFPVDGGSRRIYERQTTNR